MSGAPVLELRGVRKRYGQSAVLRGIDLTLAEHEVVCLIGASGSGKSTLLRCVDLLEPIDSGTISLQGRRIAAADADADITRRRLGIVFQGFNLFPHLTVLENLTLAPEAMTHFAHWITPVHAPKRFDTHFFLAAAPSDQVALHDGHEAVDSIWITPERAMAGTRAGTYKLVFPTEMNLKKLGRNTACATALAAARASRVVTVVPVQERAGEGMRVMRLPLEADYGGEVFEVTNPPSFAGR